MIISESVANHSEIKSHIGNENDDDPKVEIIGEGAIVIHKEEPPPSTSNNDKSMSSAAASDQAKLPHNATCVHLFKRVWFTLEHSNRARGNGKELDERLSYTKRQNDEIAQICLGWMGVGKFDDRRTWNEGQWIAFLRTWQHTSGQVFAEGATAEEQRLVNAFTIYFTFYANLPETTALPDDAPDGFDMSTAEKKAKNYLAEFEGRLGDPLAQCNKCKNCALGKKMMRCSQCHLALYCTKDCQRQDWRVHKKVCQK